MSRKDEETSDDNEQTKRVKGKCTHDQPNSRCKKARESDQKPMLHEMVLRDVMEEVVLRLSYIKQKLCWCSRYLVCK